MQFERFHPVYRAINKPLTVWGVQRRLFFMALTVGAATFNFFGSLPSGVVMSGALLGLARWAGRTDPEILPILFRSSRFFIRYDPARFDRLEVRRVSQ